MPYASDINICPYCGSKYVCDCERGGSDESDNIESAYTLQLLNLKLIIRQLEARSLV